MENVSMKSEILSSIKELKSKGVSVIMNDSYLERTAGYGLTINGGGFVVSGSIVNGHNSEEKVRILKKPSELTVNIYLNSTDKEILDQIIAIKNHISIIEKDSKSSAIVDFLKENGI